MKKPIKNLGPSCALCGKAATHEVHVELRDKSGPPLNARSTLLMDICEEETKNTEFNYWLPFHDWKRISDKWRNAGFYVSKRFCNVLIKKKK